MQQNRETLESAAKSGQTAAFAPHRIPPPKEKGGGEGRGERVGTAARAILRMTTTKCLVRQRSRVRTRGVLRTP